MNPVARIAAFGGFGGLLAALLTRATGVGLFAKWSPGADVSAEIAFGIAAALIGVFLLTQSDQTHPRTMAFALVCGLAWQPVVSGADSYLKQYVSGQTASSAEQADASLTPGSVPWPPEAVQIATSTTTNAIMNLSKVNSVEDRNSVINASKSVVDKVAKNAATQPAVRIAALRSIGLASLSANAPSVSLQTIQPLKTLANDNNPAVKAQAELALKEIATAADKSNNPAVAAAIMTK